MSNRTDRYMAHLTRVMLLIAGTCAGLIAIELCRELHLPFVLTTYPTGHQVSSQEWVDGRKRYGLGPGLPRSAIFESLDLFARGISSLFSI